MRRVATRIVGDPETTHTLPADELSRFLRNLDLVP